MSKATIVSICPFELREEKPGLIPGVFIIPPAKEGDFNILVISDSKHTIRIPVQGNKITLTEDAHILAESIVQDRMTGQLLYRSDCHPGLFWVPGELTKEQIVKQFPDKLQEAHLKQRNWYRALCKLADDDWNNYHQHKFISDIQRHAAKVMGLERDWLLVDMTDGPSKCPACFTNVDPRATICYNCKTVIHEAPPAAKTKA